MKSMLKRLFVLAILGLAVVAGAQSTGNPVEQRANQLLGKMTLEEKIDYIGGYENFYIRAIPRLGIPALKMADGPLGVRNYGPSTAYPAGIALAASWNVDLVKQVGTMMGQDARARGVHFLLGPGMNIYRAPMCGRNFEYFGEDPYLASRIAVAEILGIQSQGVIATAKHFMGNNQEWDRNLVSSDIDDRTLREIYLPAFEASVKEAHVGAIMDSYNLVNGIHMTQNGVLNTEILKRQWGFDGIVMSDWNGTYEGVAAANSGLDLEMPSGKFMNRQTLMTAVQSGSVTKAVIDEKVTRILRTAIRFGFFDNEPTDHTVPLDNPVARAAALKAARESIVLLKNDGVLPLDRAKVKEIAVIGPNALMAVTGGGGSSLVKPFSALTFAEGIRNFVGPAVKVTTARGVPLTQDIFSSTDFTTTEGGTVNGLTGEYFNSRELKGAPAILRNDAHIGFDWGVKSYSDGQPTDNFSVRWTGYFTPQHSGTHVLYVAGDDGFRLWIDDQSEIDEWGYHGEALVTKTLTFEAGKHYKVRLEYFEGGGEAKIGFGISDGQDNRALDAAKALAAKADVVILCIGFNAMSEGEGKDRNFDLSSDQLTLINEVISANKKVIAVVSAGGNVHMSDWIESIPGLLHTWYPGQEGATALAEVLFGQTNPSGKLPVTFEREWKDSATHDSYYDNGDKRVVYSEKVFLGYRHFDRSGTKPMFPFGYGLSYTTFKYSKMKTAKGKDGLVHVTFKVKNTGKREGAEVAEVYVAPRQSKVARPIKELKGFAKTNLRPGETQTVSLTLDRRAFAYFDPNASKWTVDGGEYEILVGSSSQEIKQKKKIEVVGALF